MSIHTKILASEKIAPYRSDGMRGRCFEPFGDLSMSAIPWDTIRREPDPRYDLIKSSHTRRVIRFQWTCPDGAVSDRPLELFAKRALTRRIHRLLSSPFRASKAKREWSLGLKMLRMDIPTPLPVLYAERRRFRALSENYLVTIGLEGSRSFYDALQEVEDPERRLSALSGLARFVRSGHDAGFSHDDCSAHHIFVFGPADDSEPHTRMHFIDVDNGRLRARASESLRLKNCFQLFRSMPDGGLNQREKTEFLNVLFDRRLSNSEVGDYLARVDLWHEWKRQRKRALKLLRAAKR